MKGKLALQYGELIKKMWSGTNTSVSPTQLKYVISQFATQFNGYRQHDSQELLSFLLDGLHEDLNLVTKKPYIEIEDGNGNDDEIVSKKSWEYHLKRNQSIIVKNFHGQLKSTLTCPDCKNISIKFDPFMYLSLPLGQLNLKEITVLYFTDQSSRFSKYSVKVPIDSNISVLRKEFRRNLKTKDDFIFCDMNTNRIHSTMKDDQLLSEIKSKEKILCFKGKDSKMINICQKKNDRELCG
jgi:ubiquitin C-terminal hydrolase